MATRTRLILTGAAISLAGLLLIGTAAAHETPELIDKGIASFYSDRFQGQTTASGEPFDQQALTAAHPSLPFGTEVIVTRPDNGREVTVLINDRGPFVRGRIIDLSKRAARELGMINRGTVPVLVTSVQ
ncbi:septal ring lytic transglycosylase RlpA family protein [Billgrantia montanilacus]|uniref:Endolytic peptidoglycan transglycosylase RlpA n=1 Tax=Billgrantia montanilacus TaxID=2282305 RepID=A0A368TZB4_9GAMM|nr:septal ring lytic transglycosylase RlpA family protein [Halomonas montanilacus]RCV90088.1 septal ring lytic transglycosylase RlpA family protein [Halomonas montanilacus]